MVAGLRAAAVLICVRAVDVAELNDDGFYVPPYNRRSVTVGSSAGVGASPPFDFPANDGNSPSAVNYPGLLERNYADRNARGYPPTYSGGGGGGGGSPNFQRPTYSPVVLPLVDVTRYWKLWGLQHSLCDTVSATLEENNIKELTSQQATQIGRALERSNQVYTEYHRNMVPDLINDRDPMAVEARLWLGHDQFEHDLYDCWSNLSVGAPNSPTDLSTHLFESVHDNLARSLCLPFDSYMACRELLQLPKNSIRRFKDQLKIMKEEASMLLRRMGRPTSYTYYRNQFYYGGHDAPSWADAAASAHTKSLLLWSLIISVIITSGRIL